MPTDPRDDAELVRRAQTGDDIAFGELVRRHQAVVRAFLGRFVRAPSDIDDLAQEVFLAAHRDLARCRGDGLRSWLFTIARHRALSWLRDEERRWRRQGRGFAAHILVWQSRDAEDADDDDEAARLAALEACLAELPAERVAILRAYYRDGEGTDSLEQRLDRPQGWVKVMLFRLRRTLRTCIEGRLARGAHTHG
ncbi:MAG: hypothetical protein RLZZ127_2814 [Planctomycetota bacterium]|jgi:RNA polymerase sigma-70 factor (ECF subfamily)